MKVGHIFKYGIAMVIATLLINFLPGVRPQVAQGFLSSFFLGATAALPVVALLKLERVWEFSEYSWQEITVFSVMMGGFHVLGIAVSNNLFGG